MSTARVSAAPEKDRGAAALQDPVRGGITTHRCPSARQAVRFYSRKLGEWRVKMGAGSVRSRTDARRQVRLSCPHVRRLAHALQRKAHVARLRYEDWHYHEYRWDHWLPQLWVAIGECETGLNWRHNSGSYQGAFGFATSSWDAYKPRGAPSEAYDATPRQQYQAALNIQARVGLSGWGCYVHGGYKYHMR